MLFTKGMIPWNKGIKCPQISKARLERKEQLGYLNSKATRKKMSQSRLGKIPWNKDKLYLQITGKNHWNWKGGKYKDGDGYIRIYQPNHPNASQIGYMAEHRLVVEQCLKRYIKSEEIIHHINEIKDDNRPENLYLFPNTKSHISYHTLLKSNLGLVKKITESNLL